MLSERDALGEHERSEDGTEKWWIVDSSAEFHITRSADFLRTLHLSGDKVKIGSDTLIGVEGYGSLTVLFPNKTGGTTIRLETVDYVPD